MSEHEEALRKKVEQGKQIYDVVKTFADAMTEIAPDFRMGLFMSPFDGSGEAITVLTTQEDAVPVVLGVIAQWADNMTESHRSHKMADQQDDSVNVDLKDIVFPGELN
jgi:hypothetical protein